MEQGSAQEWWSIRISRGARSYVLPASPRFDDEVTAARWLAERRTTHPEVFEGEFADVRPVKMILKPFVIPDGHECLGWGKDS